MAIDEPQIGTSRIDTGRIGTAIETATIETSVIDTVGCRTHLLEAGPPDAPTVVLVHDGAFGTDARLCWAAVIEDLARDHHVLAPDLLGWGRSDKVCFFDRSPYDPRLEQIAAVRAARAADRPVHYVGTSFGAELVVRGAAEPHWGWDAASAVAIAGTGGRLYRIPEAMEQLSSYEPSLEAARRLTSFLVTDVTSMDEHVEQRYENSLITGHWEALSALRLRNPATTRQPPQEGWPEPLRACDVPILFVEGEHDTLLEHGWAEAMAEIAPQATAVVVPGAHEPNLEHPTAIATLVRTFVAAPASAPDDVARRV